METTKTPSVKTELIDPSIENTNPENCNLSILFQKDGLVFSILRNDLGKYIVLGEYEVQLENEHTIQLFQFTEQLQGPFATVFLGYYTPKFTLIPSSLFKEENLLDYAKFQFELADDEKVRFDVLSTHGLVLVYTIEKQLEKELAKKFEYSSPRHASTFTISYYLDLYKNKPGEHIHVQVWRKHLEIIAIKNGKLLVCTSFDFTSDEDLLYFILNVYEQIDFNPESVPLKLSGEILKGSSQWKLLETYIRFVELESRPNGQYSHEFKSVQEHRYNRVFQTAQCA